MIQSKAILKNSEKYFGKWTLQVQIDGSQYDISEEVDALLGKEIDLTIKKWHPKRSLNANAYFHLLCSKIAEAAGVSNALMKNQLICDYGQYLTQDGEILTYCTKAPIEYVMELDDIHLKYDSEVTIEGEDGKKEEAHRYFVMRGSSSYDSAEMRRLIEGTVSEANELKIDTLPPKEAERLLAAWEGK